MHAARAPQPMWATFKDGSSWTMISAANGHTTSFHVQRLTRWGCWTGDLVDLSDAKQAPEDYWAPGSDVAGHQILLHDRDGSWRMVGTYTVSPDPALEWTLQIHGYPGQPTPYVIVPGSRTPSDTVTTWWTNYTPAATSACLGNDEAAAPSWGHGIHWRSTFTFDPAGDLHARYEENSDCNGQPGEPCQVEEWTFARGVAGLAGISDERVGGVPSSLVLARSAYRFTTLATFAAF